MIQIGTKIWVTDDLEGSTAGNVSTHTSQVYFDGQRVGGIKSLNVTYDASASVAQKNCCVHVVHESNVESTREFALELASHGFHVELVRLYGDFLQTEFYLSDGNLIESDRAYVEPTIS